MITRVNPAQAGVASATAGRPRTQVGLFSEAIEHCGRGVGILEVKCG